MKLPILPLAAALLCALPFPCVWAQSHSEFAKLTGLSAQSFDSTGTAVALSGNRVVSTAIGELDPNTGFPFGPTPGFAYLHDAATGAQVAQLEAGDGSFQDYFGLSAAAGGGFALVGAPFDILQGSPGDRVGSVYVFDIQSGQRLRKLTASDGAGYDLFGFSIAIDGGTAVIGAPLDQDDGRASGSVYLFDVASGLQLQKFRPNDGLQGRRFGRRVAIDQNLVVISAPGGFNGFDPVTGMVLHRRAAVYVFDIQSGLQVYKWDEPSGVEDEAFGFSVAIAANRIFVGASSFGTQSPLSDPAGSVYSYDRANGQLVHRLRPPIYSEATGFGFSVAADSGRVAVGAPYAFVDGPTSGAAFVFDASTGQPLTRLIASDSFSTGRLGWSIDIDGGVVAAGAPRYSGAAELIGATYLFDGALVNSGQSYCFQDGIGPICPCGLQGQWGEGCMNTTGRGAELFGVEDAVVGMDTLVLSVTRLPIGAVGLFFQGSGQLNLPAGDGVLCLSGSMRYPVQTASPNGNLSRSGFGAAATPGATINYQFWYRDPQNICGQGGFNFTNGWTVNW